MSQTDDEAFKEPASETSAQSPPVTSVPSLCLGCGATVPAGRAACQICGSVHRVANPQRPTILTTLYPDPISEENSHEGRHSKIMLGIVVGNIVGGIVMGVTYALLSVFSTGGDVVGTYVTTETVLVPILIGLICGVIWRRATLSTIEVWGYTLLSVIVGILFSALVLREGAICLAIASPLVLVLEVLGAFAGRAIKFRNNRLSLTAIPLIAAFLIHDIYAPHSYQSSVTDVVTINASPEKVWPHLASFSRIPDAPTFWVFRAGMPMPMQSIASAPTVGAARACIFSKGAVFMERIVDVEPKRRLAFIILHQPSDPEIFNHATIVEGEFDLRGSTDGKSTILTGTTRYSLHAFPGIYFDQWAQLIGHNVHLRVMDHIKMECEHEPNRN